MGGTVSVNVDFSCKVDDDDVDRWQIENELARGESTSRRAIVGQFGIVFD